jgi:glycerophosphoryl diester phosphodiesterase
MRSDARALALTLTGSAALALVGALGSCATRGSVSIPSFGEASLIRGAAAPAADGLKRLSGVYGAGSGALPGEVVVRGTRDTLSVFTSTKVAYAITKPGCLEGGTRLVFEGHWRHALNTETGLVRLELLPREAARAVCAGDLAAMPPDFRLEGATGNGSDLPSDRVTFPHVREVAPVPTGFIIAAHHGACRTIDECGVSENSLESIRAVESYGASAVELDVRLTRDGVPILFHDETLSPRLTNGPYCHGPVAELPLAHLRANCTLEYGERVPTLEEALSVALSETELVGLWLDVKVVEALEPTMELAARTRRLAAERGRAFQVAVGLSERDILDAFLRVPKDKRVPCLVELEPSDVLRAGCIAWAPRWTRGPMKEEVARLQAQGIGVYFWTIDEAEYLDLFVQTARPNGLLSDRAGLVLHRFHTLYAPDGRWP